MYITAFKHAKVSARISAAALFLISCGPSKHEVNGVERLVFSPKPPATYLVADPECMQRNDANAINSAGLWQYQDGLDVTQINTLLENTTSESSIQSDFISFTGFDRQFQRRCNDRACSNSGFDFQSTSSMRPMRVCQPESNYPRDSYEGIALTSVNYINQAGASYAKLSGKEPSKIHLEVMPSFMSNVPVLGADGVQYDERTYVTDNLAYFPLLKSIMVFAQSMDSAQQGLDRYWEWRFTFMHEYGHHIEEMELASTTVIDAEWQNISEGFADLLADHMTRSVGNIPPQDLTELDCIGKNRDVNSRFFADGVTVKRLTTENINTLGQSLRSSLKLAGRACEGINYADSHIIGAIYAHLMEKTLQAATSHLKDPEEKLRQSFHFSVEWARQLLKLYQASGQSQRTFNFHVAALEKVLNSASNWQKTEICNLHADLFPIVSPPFGSYCASKRTFNR